MFIAMNRFRMKKSSEKNFEQVWLSRAPPREQSPLTSARIESTQ